MFSSTRLHIFVCLALGIAGNAAPAVAPGANMAARSPDIYDVSGGVAGLILGLEGESSGGNSDEDVYILKRDSDSVEARSPDIYDASGGVAGLLLGLEGESSGGNSDEDVYILKRDVYDLGGGLAGLLFGLDGESNGGNSDEDVYILKRQLAGLDIGSRLGTNMGIAHAAGLGEAALGVSSGLGVEARSPDIYDASGGIAALLLGIEGGGNGGDSDEDVYILKRDDSEVEARSPDIYDASGGVAGLLLGLEGESNGGDSDEDIYILKRQLAATGHGLVHKLGLANAAALGGSSSLGVGAKIDARSPDVYDLSGGLVGLLLGLDGESNGGDSDEDVYVLKRQLTSLDAIIRFGLAHAAAFGQGALGDASSLTGSQ